MAEAIVVEGAERGHTAKVCAEPSCPIHFPQRSDRANSEQVAKEREQRRRELEKRKLETTVRHRILAEVLKKIGAPLDRCDLVLIADALLERMEPLRREVLARRHKAVEVSSREATYPEVQKGLVRLLRQLDESGLSKLIVEMILLGSVDTASQQDADALLNSARQHRVDTTKLRSAVLAELATKQAKTDAKRKATLKKTTAKASKAA